MMRALDFFTEFNQAFYLEIIHHVNRGGTVQDNYLFLLSQEQNVGMNLGSISRCRPEEKSRRFSMLLGFSTLFGKANELWSPIYGDAPSAI